MNICAKGANALCLGALGFYDTERVRLAQMEHRLNGRRFNYFHCLGVFLCFVVFRLTSVRIIDDRESWAPSPVGNAQ